MAGQLLDMYIKVTAANLAHYVTNDVVNCNSPLARYAVQNGDATYCDSAGDAVVPAWPPTLMSAVVENAAAVDVVVTFDMAMAITDETGWSVTVDGVAASLDGVTPIAVSGSTVTVKLDTAVANGEVVLLSYDASAGNAENTNGTQDAVSVDTVNKTVTNNVAAQELL